jgi:MFS family permease
MLPLSFLVANWRLIGFGVFMCFCSNPGQTYFISLFSGEIRGEFALSHGEFGTIYSIGTLASAATFVWLGRLIDRVPLVTFATAVLAALAGMCFFMGAVWGAGALAVAVFGLRLFGQGLSSHTAITTMGRYFEAQRGRTISIASLGQLAGQAVFPPLVVAAFATVSWRLVWNGAGLVWLAMIPFVFVLLRGHGVRERVLRASRAAITSRERDRALGEALRDPGLWLRLPTLFAPAFITTGFIFHQVHVAETKGWSLTLMAASFTMYAAASVVVLIASGPLVDRVSARRLVPVYLLPLALGAVALVASDAPVMAPVFLGLLGVSTGISFVVSGALWAELYGVTHLGAIRAFGHTVMVFSSGLAPAAMGLLIDLGTSVETIAVASAAYCAAASALATTAGRGHRSAALGTGG